MFRVLGDPFRRRLPARPAAGEVCVSELAELEDEKLTTVAARLKTSHAVRVDADFPRFRRTASPS
jgi:hypothetical protein